MKRLTSILIFLAIFVVLSGTAIAQKKGDKEIIFNGTAIFQKTNYGSISITFLMGYFITDSDEIGGGPIGSISFTKVTKYVDYDWRTGNVITEEETDVSYDLGAQFFYRRNFKTENAKMYPYLEGAFYQYTFNPAEGSDIADYSYVQASIGFKYFLKPKVAIDFRGGYGFMLKHPDQFGIIISTFGLAYIF